MNGLLKTTTALTGLLRKAQRPRLLNRFRRDERGVLAVPTIVFVFGMLSAGGIGMDLVHMEHERTELQYTLDRAVLAAADLDQTLAPKDVVKDYLTKAGLGHYYREPYVEIHPQEALDPTKNIPATSKLVTAEVTGGFPIQWLKFAGFDQTLDIYAGATAEESIGRVEISMVLDVSGSMGNNYRLPNLKVAAKDFVQTLKENTQKDNLSVSIVPYSTQVAMPKAFLDRVNTYGAHDYSHCLNFESSDFATTALSPDITYDQTLHFSRWSQGDWRQDPSRTVQDPICTSHVEHPERTALLMSDDVAKMHAYIDAFEPGENTSIDLGMKWGTALLDPSVQGIISELSGEGKMIDGKFADRPVAFDSADKTLKVVVLMSDGANTSQYYVRDDMRSGLSPVWYNEEAEVYSTYDPASGTYYHHHPDPSNGSWPSPTPYHLQTTESDHPYGNGVTYETERTCRRYRTNYWGRRYCARYRTTTTEVQEVGYPDGAQQLSYVDLFAQTSNQYIYSQMFGDWMGSSSAQSKWLHNALPAHDRYIKDQRTKAVCDAAKAKGIVVFTIGFEAPASGEVVLQNCASSDAHFYDVRGLEIQDAFASIASAIRQLRLTE